MKTAINLTLATIIALFGTLEMKAQWKNKRVKGSGNVTTTNRTVQPYDEIAAVGSITVVLEAGDEGAITIKADDNLHEYVEVENDGDKLKVKMKKGTSYSSKNDIIVKVPFRDLSKVSITGSGDVMGKDAIKGDHLALTVTGSGDMLLEMDANHLDAKVTGSGDMKLSGKTDSLEIKVSGSGDFMGYGLKAKNTEVYISGSGDAEVVASSSIKARVHGSGDVSYKGNPSKSDTKVLGSGSISSQ